jgi:hypothetical protein
MAGAREWCRAAAGLGWVTVLTGCGSPPQAQTPSTPSPVAALAAPAPASVPKQEFNEPAAGPPATAGDLQTEATGSAPASNASAHAAKVAKECAELCDNAAQACSRRSARECRANCGKYQSLADRCEVQVLGAIRCQAATPKLVCSNVADDCVQQFRALSACEQGEDGIPMPKPAAFEAPEGWERIEDRAANFSVHLPHGATLGEHQGHRTWSAVDAQGVRFLAVVLPSVGAAATEKRLMETTIHFLGHRCAPFVRLHGRFETEHDVAERFDARCENGDRWQGILRASSERLVMIAEVVPPGKQGAGEPFYYSFEYLQ